MGRQIKNRVGETTTANNGLKATIIAYRGCQDIDIRFEDGTILTCTYANFKEGRIGKRNVVKRKAANTITPLHIGESKIMKRSGMKATILAWRGSFDITIQFEDGVVLEGIGYVRFKNGTVSHPNENMLILGKKKEMKNLQVAEVITYRSSSDIDVKFEDGTIVRHVSYLAFQNGNIINPMVSKSMAKARKERVGCSLKMTNGLMATIIEYRKATDMDVLFEDGYIAHHVRYDNFIIGRIGDPKHDRITPERAAKYIGQKRVMNNGEEAEVIAYRSTSDIDVRFADGTIVKGKAFSSFKIGAIGNPSKKVVFKRSPGEMLGECRVMRNGLKAEIVGYKNSCDITIRFEDGTCVEHRTYMNFRVGNIGHPGIRVRKAAGVKLA